MGEIGVKMRKSVAFVIRGCSRSICNHPFLVGIICFLIYLYRSSPFIFSLLVAASPVLICTALLLGALLSFGQVNLPEIEIEIEERTSHGAVSLNTEVSESATIVHQNDNHYVERQSSVGPSNLGEVHGENTSDNTAPLITERSLEKGNCEVWKENVDLADSKYKEKAEWYDGRLSDDEIVENHYSSIPQETSGKSVESDDERSESDSFDSERVNVDSLDSPPRSPWKRVGEREEEDEDVGEDTGLDSGSDRAESSSPDASMADIMPMLDELHPLLDEDGPQPINMSENGSDPESDRSSKSSASIHEETENEEDSEIGEDENEDGEDEGVVSGDKAEEKKSAITWTEEDEKNLMDLGSSEIERNQRLENLILRRRARKNMSMVPDLNLIDLESTNFPFNIPPISTTRQNPFVSSRDSYDNSGLPPIPGSAPSILLPRRNPFDIPYDSSEEKPNLVGDGPHEELKAFQSREPFFKRHESFNVGPSIFAQERQDVRLRPFFVPERMVGEESSYSVFQRQSSELSESKVSSVPETESLGSVEDFEERKLTDEDNGTELESLPSMKEVVNEESPPSPSSNKEETSEEDEPQENEPISDIEHVSEHVGHGSQSSEDEEEESLELEVEANEHHSNSESVERIYSRDSSSSSLSEVSERVFTETEMGTRNADFEEPVISTQTSLESTDLRITSNVVDEVPHREPVYDSSPPSVKKNMSSSSISSDVHAESDPVLPPVLVKRTVSFVERESDVEISESSSVHLVDEQESRVINVIDERECDNISAHVMESSSEVLTEANLVDQNEHGEACSSSSDEDQNLVHLMKDENSVISGDDFVVGVSGEASTSQLSVEHSVEKKEIIENVQSPNSDSDVYLEAYEKLSLTPSAEGNAVSFFNDKPTNLKHLNEVQAHSTVAESSNGMQTIQEWNMPELQELDNEIPSNVNSPLSPDFISIPSTASGAASPHTDLQTITEEADEIKEIDEGILSELDSVGDFSVKQWGSGSDESEKRVVNSVEESSSWAHHAEINPMEANTENSREEVEIYEHGMENVSEIQTSERCVAEHIDISDKEYNEREGRDSPDQSSSDDDTPPVKINENREDQDYGITEAALDIKKAEPESSESGSSKLLNQSEDTDFEFGQNSDIEIEKSAVLESPQAELVTEETIIEQEKSAISEPIQVERVIKENEKSADLELNEAKLKIEETVTEHSEAGTSVVVNANEEAPVLETGTIGDANFDKQVVENHILHDSVSHIPPLVEPREIQVASIDPHVARPIPSEGASVPLEQVLDDKTEKSIEVEELKVDSSIDLHVAGPSSSEGACVPSEHILDDKMEKSIEVEEHKADSFINESNVKEISEVAAEKPDHEEQVHDEKPDHEEQEQRKGKASKSSSTSSSSSSSSSSDSSSSDSDKE